MNLTGRIPLAESVSTGNIRLGTWTSSYGGLTVCIRRHDSGLARWFVVTVRKHLWAIVPSRVVLDLCSQRSNCIAGSLLEASSHTATGWRSGVGVSNDLFRCKDQINPGLLSAPSEHWHLVLLDQGHAVELHCLFFFFFFSYINTRIRLRPWQDPCYHRGAPIAGIGQRRTQQLRC